MGNQCRAKQDKIRVFEKSLKFLKKTLARPEIVIIMSTRLMRKRKDSKASKRNTLIGLEG